MGEIGRKSFLLILFCISSNQKLLFFNSVFWKPSCTACIPICPSPPPPAATVKSCFSTTEFQLEIELTAVALHFSLLSLSRSFCVPWINEYCGQRDGEYKLRSHLRGFCHYPHKGFDAGCHSCKTTEYKAPLSPLILNVMYCVRVSLWTVKIFLAQH